MTKYLIKTHDGMVHTIDAATYVIDATGLRFVGDAGVTQGLFPSFEWMKVLTEPSEAPVSGSETTPTEAPATVVPELAGE